MFDIGANGSEASAEEHIGQPLSPAKIHIPGADAVAKAEGYTDGRVSALAWRTRRGGSDLVCIGIIDVLAAGWIQKNRIVEFLAENLHMRGR